MGQCHAAAGDLAKAREAFARAASVLSTTEFNVERRLLESAMEQAGLSGRVPSPGPSPIESERSYVRNLEEAQEAAYDQLRAAFPPIEIEPPAQVVPARSKVLGQVRRASG
jgi:hypothetical protein